MSRRGGAVAEGRRIGESDAIGESSPIWVGRLVFRGGRRVSRGIFGDFVIGRFFVCQLFWYGGPYENRLELRFRNSYSVRYWQKLKVISA